MDTEARATRTLRLLGIVALSAAIAWAALMLLSKIKIVLLILLGAVFFAYLVYPPVRLLRSRGLPLWLSILIVYVVLGVVVGTAVGFGGPAIASEARTFSRELPSIMQQLRDGLVNANNSVLAAVPIETRQTAANYLNNGFATLETAAGAYTGKALSILLSVVSVISALVIIPILAFYILLDADKLSRGFTHLFPLTGRPKVTLVLQDIDQVLGGFIRGQIIVAAFVAVAVTIGLMILHIRYAFLIGLFAGLVDMIPYVGAIAGAVPAVLLAFFSHGIGSAIVVILVFAAIYEIEGHFVAPSIVGKRVGLSALLVVIAILIGAEFGGIVGMFVAVPLAAIVRVMWKRFAYPLEVSAASAPIPASVEPSTIVVATK
ncbi:MAG: AI-2E family transporter [Candidatus Eremiobacteraeota bacterium]|nr:AI-2E family transporter [Candidatus Eremiobacteraeota bacterium]